MKSKIVILVSTDNLLTLQDEDGQDISEYIETNLHEAIKNSIKSYVTNNLEEDVINGCEEVYVDGYDSFDNYGDVEVKVVEVADETSDAIEEDVVDDDDDDLDEEEVYNAKHKKVIKNELDTDAEVVDDIINEDDLADFK